MDFLSQSTTIVVAIVLMLLYNIWRMRMKKPSNNIVKGKQAPIASGALPLIGHLHLLGNQIPHARTLWIYHRTLGETKTILRTKVVVVIISEWLERLAFNIITKMIAGKRYFEYLEDVDDVEAHAIVKLIKRIARDLDILVGKWVEEHVENESSEKHDFIDVMLSVIEDDPASGHTRDTIIKANITNLMVAGSETTSTTMTWILAILLNNMDALKRAQVEIDLHIGRDRRVEASDIKNLVYLQAIVKETMRLYPAGPLLLPHEAREDCHIHGYYVPKGTRVFANNVWKLHRDPSIWSEPEKFSPERFINENGQVDEGNHFDFLPFGLGRRACPGSNFATQVTLITIARLLQGFDMKVPMDEPIDMREGFGITLLKLTPLQVHLTPRLPYQLYQ